MAPIRCSSQLNTDHPKRISSSNRHTPADLAHLPSSRCPATCALRVPHRYRAPAHRHTVRLRRHRSAPQAGVIRSHLRNKCLSVPGSVISIRRRVATLEEKATLSLGDRQAHRARILTRKRRRCHRRLPWVPPAAHIRTSSRDPLRPIQPRRPRPRLTNNHSSMVPRLAVPSRPHTPRHRILSSAGSSRNLPPRWDRLRGNPPSLSATLNRLARTSSEYRQREVATRQT